MEDGDDEQIDEVLKTQQMCHRSPSNWSKTKQVDSSQRAIAKKLQTAAEPNRLGFKPKIAATA
ncbi:hypothetical protein RMSM_04081 [Rhodopirellula maiorica SM1]|uniref:Uncharacterized protein n=1 Tax=Rhodopirellula maiorica SM1 TaxID=1265738 RepID=M5RIG4_9BACT|nr:hypothetical protein RMSM_04081 [Rhodopirellula maiorica SM1]